MAAQKGPGEGYNAARDDALALDPSLKCRAVYDYNGKRVGFIVEDGCKKSRGTGIEEARESPGMARGEITEAREVHP